MYEFFKKYLPFEMVDEARKWYTMYSIWIFAILSVSGDIYNLAISYKLILESTGAILIPAKFTIFLNIIGFIGGVLRLVKQKKLALLKEGVTEEQAKEGIKDVITDVVVDKKLPTSGDQP